jgi:hypothetical protein
MHAHSGILGTDTSKSRWNHEKITREWRQLDPLPRKPRDAFWNSQGSQSRSVSAARHPQKMSLRVANVIIAFFARMYDSVLPACESSFFSMLWFQTSQKIKVLSITQIYHRWSAPFILQLKRHLLPWLHPSQALPAATFDDLRDTFVLTVRALHPNNMKNGLENEPKRFKPTSRCN